MPKASKTLIAFYSRAHENYVNGAIRELEVGNTERAAEIIAKAAGGELFRIEQTKPYSDSYNECIAEAQADQKKGARPELKSLPENVSEYDTVFLCYPNYWSTMPMAVFTFLEKLDFSGKTIKPLCTHEGSGLGGSVDDIRRLCSSAKVKEGLAVRGG